MCVERSVCTLHVRRQGVSFSTAGRIQSFMSTFHAVFHRNGYCCQDSAFCANVDALRRTLSVRPGREKESDSSRNIPGRGAAGVGTHTSDGGEGGIRATAAAAPDTQPEALRGTAVCSGAPPATPGSEAAIPASLVARPDSFQWKQDRCGPLPGSALPPFPIFPLECGPAGGPA